MLTFNSRRPTDRTFYVRKGETLSQAMARYRAEGRTGGYVLLSLRDAA